MDNIMIDAVRQSTNAFVSGKISELEDLTQKTITEFVTDVNYFLIGHQLTNVDTVLEISDKIITCKINSVEFQSSISGFNPFKS